MTQRAVWLLVLLGLAVLFGALWYYPPTTSADMAAWVQAIGSLIGLAVAIWLAMAPQRAAREEAESNARSFVGLLAGVIEDLITLARRGDFSNIAVRRVALDDAISIGRSVRVDLLPLPILSAVTSMRSNAAQLAKVIDMVTSHGYSETSRKVLLESLIDSATKQNRLMGAVEQHFYRASGKPMIDIGTDQA